MKKTFLVISLLIFIFTLTACDDVCVGADCVTGGGGGVSDNIINFSHINGEGEESDQDLIIIFEFEATNFIKYQISYVSCTCRELNVNYHQVAYVEINKYSDDISFLSFNVDSDGHYTPGVWGDSTPIPTNNKTLEDFENEFIPWIVGKTLADFEGISVFTNDAYGSEGQIQNTTTIDEQEMIDAYATSSVSTNNMIRAMKTLLEYHQTNYEK